MGQYSIDADNTFTLKKRPLKERAFSASKSLTMSYFHTGIRTIIGAEAFHCPVRDGKEWYHLAMVVRHNFLPSWLVEPSKALSQSRQPTYRANQLHRINEPASYFEHTGFLNASTWHNFLEITSKHIHASTRIKVIGSSRTSN